jgi:predicted negative regulator of RcsB-dependent stress response
MSRGEKWVVAVAFLVALIWMFGWAYFTADACNSAYDASKTASDSLNVIRANDDCGVIL